MSPDPLIATPTDVTAQTPPPAPAADLPAPTAEQVRAADRVFTATHQHNAAETVLGLWTGALILHDLAVEHFAADKTEEEERKRQPEPEPQPGA
jgi:hypothetical protein